jgi:hypothetical protein
MDDRRRFSAGLLFSVDRVPQIIIVFLFISLFIFPYSIGASDKVVVGTNVVFAPSQSWTNITFSQQQSIDSPIAVDANSVTFGSLDFEVVKRPAAHPKLDLTITKFVPLAGVGAVAIGFTATSVVDSKVWFNITGLHSSSSYQVFVDGVLLVSILSDGSGGISFFYSKWSTQTFAISLVGSGGGGGGGQLPDSPLDFTWFRGLSGEFCFFITVGAEDYTQLFWDFGDGTTTDAENPCRTFQEGNYTVRLTGLDALGRTKIVEKELVVVAGFLYIVLVAVMVTFIAVGIEVRNRWVRLIVLLSLIYLVTLFFLPDVALPRI